MDLLLAGDHSAEEERTATASAIRSERFLPWLSFLMALFSLVGFLCVFFAIGIWLMQTGVEEPPALFNIAIVFFLELGVLALAL